MSAQERAARRKARVLKAQEQRMSLVSGIGESDETDPWEQRQQRRLAAATSNSAKSDVEPNLTLKSNSGSIQKPYHDMTNAGRGVSNDGQQKSSAAQANEGGSDWDATFLDMPAAAKANNLGAYFAELLYTIGLIFIGCALAASAASCVALCDQPADDAQSTFQPLPAAELSSRSPNQELECTGQYTACAVALGNYGVPFVSGGWQQLLLLLGLRVAVRVLGKGKMGLQTVGGVFTDVVLAIKHLVPDAFGTNIDSMASLLQTSPALQALNEFATLMVATLCDFSVVYVVWGCATWVGSQFGAN